MTSVLARLPKLEQFTVESIGLGIAALTPRHFRKLRQDRIQCRRIVICRSPEFRQPIEENGAGFTGSNTPEHHIQQRTLHFRSVGMIVAANLSRYRQDLFEQSFGFLQPSHVLKRDRMSERKGCHALTLKTPPGHPI
jgi:hypothetical protein